MLDPAAAVEPLAKAAAGPQLAATGATALPRIGVVVVPPVLDLAESGDRPASGGMTRLTLWRTSKPLDAGADDLGGRPAADIKQWQHKMRPMPTSVASTAVERVRADVLTTARTWERRSG